MALLNNPNPLENELILNNLFKYVNDSKDLQNGRLVCHLWKRTSLKQWRSAGILFLPVVRFRRMQSKYLLMSEYLDLKSDASNGLELERKPFQRVRLQEWSFPDRERFEGDQEVFPRSVGEVVKYLHLDHCGFHDFPIFRAMFDGSMFPALEKLVLSSPRFFFVDTWEQQRLYANLRRNHAQAEDFQFSLKILEMSRIDDLLRDTATLLTLFYLMPNLQEIRITETDGRGPLGRQVPSGRYLESLLITLNQARELHDKKLNIQNLDIMDFFMHATRSSLPSFESPTSTIPLDSPLERLTIDIGANTSSESIAKRIFAKQSESLAVLEAFRAPINLPFVVVPFSEEMKKLKELHLWGSFTTNLTFLQHTPKLETLILKGDCFDKRYKIASMLDEREVYLLRYQYDLVEKTLRSVTRRGSTASEEDLVVATMKNLDIDYNFSARTIPSLAKWLPNITTLRMVLTNELLQAVSRAWPNLVELVCLFGSQVDDDGITSLLQFSHLRQFKSNAFCNGGLLSSSSANRVFLKMRALESLEICVSCNMSVKAEEELTRKIAHVKVIRNYDVAGERPHSHDECCERIKFLRDSVEPEVLKEVKVYQTRSSSRRGRTKP